MDCNPGDGLQLTQPPPRCIADHSTTAGRLYNRSKHQEALAPARSSQEPLDPGGWAAQGPNCVAATGCQGPPLRFYLVSEAGVRVPRTSKDPAWTTTTMSGINKAEVSAGPWRLLQTRKRSCSQGRLQGSSSASLARQAGRQAAAHCVGLAAASRRLQFEADGKLPVCRPPRARESQARRPATRANLTKRSTPRRL